MTGILIAIEGIDGSGKTTISKRLVDILSSRGLKAAYTYEPFNSPFSYALQTVKNEGINNPYIDALAMASDRAYHYYNVIVPLLQNGWIVVCDRYFYSSYAYQSAMGAPLKWIMDINSIFKKPDIAIYLDIEVDKALERLKNKSGKWRFYEEKQVLERVREIYLNLVNNKEMIMVKADKSIDSVLDDVLKVISAKVKI